MTQMSLWSRLREKFLPRSEQIRGMLLIVKNRGSRLFLPPGKGKTATVLKAFSVLKAQGHVDALLVIAPLRVIVTSWPSQLERWEDFSHLNYVTIHGGKTERLKAMDTAADVYLMNVEGLLSSEWKVTKRGHSYILNDEALRWLNGKRVMLAIDESTKFKNPNASRYNVLKRYLPYIHRIVIMTGTPKPNKLEDLFAQAYLTDEGADLGQYITHFRNEFMQRSFDGFGYDPLPGSLQKIAVRMAPTTLQLAEEEVVPVSTVDVWVKMPPDVQEQYDTLLKKFMVMIDGKLVLAPTSAALLNKMRQLVQGAIYFDPDAWVPGPEGEPPEEAGPKPIVTYDKFGHEVKPYVVAHTLKVDALETLMEELNGEPLFLMYQFKHDVARIAERLGRSVPYVGSGVSAAQGAAWCQAFGAGTMPLLAGHPMSVAHGVDGLQNNCKTMCWFGIDHSWENYYQALKRIARDGTKADAVTIYRILVDCPTERATLASITNKKSSEAEFLAYIREFMVA